MDFSKWIKGQYDRFFRDENAIQLDIDFTSDCDDSDSDSDGTGTWLSWFPPFSQKVNKLSPRKIMSSVHSELRLNSIINDLDNRAEQIKAVYRSIDTQQAGQSEIDALLAEGQTIIWDLEETFPKSEGHEICWSSMDRFIQIRDQLSQLLSLIDNRVSLEQTVGELQKTLTEGGYMSHLERIKCDDNLYQARQAALAFLEILDDQLSLCQKHLAKITETKQILGLDSTVSEANNDGDESSSGSSWELIDTNPKKLVPELEAQIERLRELIEKTYRKVSQTRQRKSVSRFVHKLESREDCTGKRSWDDLKIWFKSIKWQLTGQRIECLICFDETKNFYELPCGHQYCRECWEHHIKAEIEAGRADSIRCPNPDCRQEHHIYRWLRGIEGVDSQSDQDISVNGDGDDDVVAGEGSEENNPRTQLRRFQKHGRLRQELARGDKAVACIRPGCGGLILNPSNNRHIRCTECLGIYCRDCKKLHNNVRECADARFEKQTEHKNEFKINGVLYKRCPKCQRPTDRSRGCNHMTCPCGFHWHWPSRSKWKGYDTGYGYTWNGSKH